MQISIKFPRKFISFKCRLCQNLHKSRRLRLALCVFHENLLRFCTDCLCFACLSSILCSFVSLDVILSSKARIAS